jgi:hypothetical protein
MASSSSSSNQAVDSGLQEELQLSAIVDAVSAALLAVALPGTFCAAVALVSCSRTFTSTAVVPC